MPTPNMASFIAHNANSPVIEGQRLTPDGRSVTNMEDMRASDRVLYRLENGQSFTITREDSRSAPDFKPDWGYDEEE